MCMYDCMCVCIYVCMYVCLPACLYVCIHVCVYVCMYVCMYACMYVYNMRVSVCAYTDVPCSPGIRRVTCCQADIRRSNDAHVPGAPAHVGCWRLADAPPSYQLTSPLAPVRFCVLITALLAATRALALPMHIPVLHRWDE